MSEAKSVNAPFASHFKLSSKLSPSTQADVAYMARVPYSSAVGSLMYAMICTRPDLTYAVSMVSRYMAKPGKRTLESYPMDFLLLEGVGRSVFAFWEKFIGGAWLCRFLSWQES